MSEWVPATEAELAMRDALRAGDQELYFRILARIELLLPVSADALAGRAPIGWGTWTSADRTHVLAFTSPEAMAVCLAEHAGSARKIAYHQLAQTWPNLEWWLAVNPGLPIEAYLPAWFVSQLSRGDVRLPGRPGGPRGRVERLEGLQRARAVAAVPAAALPAASASSGSAASPGSGSSPGSASSAGASGSAVGSAAVSPAAPGAAGSAPVSPASIAAGSAPVSPASIAASAAGTGGSGPGGQGFDGQGSGGSGPGSRGSIAAFLAGSAAAATSAAATSAASSVAAGSTAAGSAAPAQVGAGSAGAGPASRADVPPPLAQRSPAPMPQLSTAAPPYAPASSPYVHGPQSRLGGYPAAEEAQSPVIRGQAAAPMVDDRPTDDRPTDVRPIDPRPSDSRPGDERPIGERPIDGRPGDAWLPDGRLPQRLGPGSRTITTAPTAEAVPGPASSGLTSAGSEARREDGALQAPGPARAEASAGPAAPARAEASAGSTAPPGPRHAEPDGPDFDPANDVETSLFAAAEEGDTDAFLSTLLLAKVLVPLAPGATANAQPGDDDFQWLTDTLEDNPYVVVFTSQERIIDHLGAPVETARVRFVQLIRHWPDPEWSFAVNPGTPVGAKLPGAQIVALASWADEVGLSGDHAGDHGGEHSGELPVAAQPAGSTAPEAGPTMMQKVIPPGQVDYYLDRGYDRISGFVHRASEVAHLRTPVELFTALGLHFAGSPFASDAIEAYVLRWAAHRPNLYRIPYGGQHEAGMRAMQGWVIERAPFRGNGFAPGESSDIIAEFKVDSARLPHGAQLWRMTAAGTETLVALLDADGPQWRRVLAEA